MKHNGYHTAEKKKILQRTPIRYVGKGKRVPVKGIEAHRVAWEILDELEE